MRDYLKKLRQGKGLSQSSVADLLGISQNYYSWIESGERQKDISLDLIMQLADIFNVPFQELARMEQEYKNSLQQAG